LDSICEGWGVRIAVVVVGGVGVCVWSLGIGVVGGVFGVLVVVRAPLLVFRHCSVGFSFLFFSVWWLGERRGGSGIDYFLFIELGLKRRGLVLI
jgi:hypothetical protein